MTFKIFYDIIFLEKKKRKVISMMYKNVNIPDEWIESTVEKLDISMAEAIDMYLSDNGIEVNEEQEKLDAHAKKIKIQHGAVADKPKKKTKRERKPNELKRTLIEVITDAMENYLGEEVTVRNIEKYIDFSIDEREFTINLVEHRKPKK